MGGLSHVFEAAGLATTQISLIRPHTETIKPPRALWVPFELGRPLGQPGDAEFQKRVLLSVLNLLEAPAGPLIEDFPEDAPDSTVESGPVACPVSFAPVEEAATNLEKLISDFRKEAKGLMPWYGLAREERGRTTTGTSGLDPEGVINYVAEFALGKPGAAGYGDLSPLMAIKTAVEDLKAFYFESVSAQPGAPGDIKSLTEWFWGTTRAALVIEAARKACLNAEDKNLKGWGPHMLVPRNQAYRFK